MTPAALAAVALLEASNVFMTLAWHGRLKHKAAPVCLIVRFSSGVAASEYCLQAPADGIGHGRFSAAELETIPEVTTLLVFAVFSVWFLGEPLRSASRRSPAEPSSCS